MAPPIHEGDPAPQRRVETNEQAHHNDLQQFCYTNSIAVLTNLTQTVGIDLSLFSSKELKTKNVTVTYLTEQLKSGLTESNDCNSGSNEGGSSSNNTNQDGNRETKLWDKWEYKWTFESWKASRLLQIKNVINKQATRDRQKKARYCYHAIVEDLGTTKRHPWEPQVDELKKLPMFMRQDIRESNMLLYSSCPSRGLKGPQLDMMFSGAKVCLKLGENDVCAVHINMGPGDCKWMAVPGDDPLFTEWGKCRFFVRTPLWMRLDDLQEANVRVYCFTQKPGDMVWVGSGTFYCLEALGDLNTVVWNQAPMTAWMHKIAVDNQEALRRFSIRCDDMDHLAPIKMLDLSWGIVLYRDHTQEVPVLKDQGLAEILADMCTDDLIRLKGEMNKAEKRRLNTIYQLDKCNPTDCHYCMKESFNIAYVHRNLLFISDSTASKQRKKLVEESPKSFCSFYCYEEFFKSEASKPLYPFVYCWTVEELQKKLREFVTKHSLPIVKLDAI